MAKTKIKPQSIQNAVVFRAYRNGAYSTTAGAWTKLPFEAEDYDPSSLFDVTNNRFVAPVAGYYHFDGKIFFETAKTVNIVQLYKNGSGISRGEDIRVSANLGSTGLCLATDVYLAKNDYVELWYYCDTVSVVVPTSIYTNFSGHLISR